MLSAPSGAGKTTFAKRLLRSVPGLRFSVSHTTRQARAGEQNGREYFFVSREEFEAMIRHDEFLEYAEVFGNYYGTARRFLREAESTGYDLLLDIDVQGAAQVKAKVPDAVTIFVLPPDRDKLEWRLRNRGLDSEEVIRRRLVTASREIENYDKYDYILINDRLEQSMDALRAIVLSERLRHRGDAPSADQLPLNEIAKGCRLDNIRAKVQPILASFLTSATQAGHK